MSLPVPNLRLEFDPALPVSQHREDIARALAAHRVIIVAGATGSGKSTQLPKICLTAGRGRGSGRGGLIGHTQPRRIAARALAARIAQELGSRVGEAVGCQVRFEDRTGPRTQVKLMTDGILLRQLAADPDLKAYDTLIIDEAHERSLNIDLLLGSLKRLTRRRDELRVIITSATIDTERLSAFFDGAPVIEVSGRSFPVDIRYRPLAAEDEDAAELSLPEGIVAAVKELGTGSQDPRGDVLVFLPGEKHIREAADALREAKLPGTEVLPLFARLSAQDQERIFQAHSARRVILATNVAETSLTVPKVRHVIDSGLARISRYSVRGKVQRLPLEPISRASADQRKGRAGREAPGVCIRLYSEEDFSAREAFTPPEILRTHLASVLLQMAASSLGDPEDFPFLDPPDTRLVNDGLRQLQELGAMDAHRRITPLGRQIAALPCDPKLGRMLLAAARHHCLTELLIITAFLAAQDPRDRPGDAQKQADEKHAAYADARSDFVTALNLWQLYQQRAAELSGSQLRKWARENFLSFVRLREWQDLHSQLKQAVRDLGLRFNDTAADHAAVHRAILSGLLGSIGVLDEKRVYEGARGTRFVIAPGTPLASRPPKWVVAASLLETTRLYARMVAAVQPGWIEAAGQHLLKREYTDPHWVADRGQVTAYESVSLYGLLLAAQRRVNYGSVAPQDAHAIFIQEALVAGRSRLSAPFLAANQALRAEIELKEAKVRRRDILVDDAEAAQFYATRVPQSVNSVAGFERWWRITSQAQPALLTMTPADLMRRAAPESATPFFPDSLEVEGNALPLRYVFAPGAADDGATLLVPQPLLSTLDPERLAWLVPGWRQEKVSELLRALPKNLRRQLVPVPDHAREALASLPAGALPPFHTWLAGWISQRTGERISAADLAALGLPDHLRLNLRVLAAADQPRIVAEGRDLAPLRRHGPAGVRPAVTPAARPSATPIPGLHRKWDFGELPESRRIERAGIGFSVWPALADRIGGVEVVESATAAEAQELTRAGIARLLILALPQQAALLRRKITDDKALVLKATGLALNRPLAEAFADRTFRECFLPPDLPLPRDAAAFTALLDARRAELDGAGTRFAHTLNEIISEWRAARTALGKLSPQVFAESLEDMQAQLAALLPADFLDSTPQPWLGQLPRYLKAICRRAERLQGNLERDSRLAAQVRPFLQALSHLARRGVGSAARPALRQLRWMIEEFRLSLYAQELKTLEPVSEKRLAQQLERIRQQESGVGL